MKHYNKPQVNYLGYRSVSDETSIVPLAALVAGVTMAQAAAAAASGVAIAMAKGGRDIVISHRYLSPIYTYKIA
jgi:hypothetical protein